MADFSKQYLEIDPLFPLDAADFDYEEMLATVDNGFAVIAICEGLGTYGVGKSETGERVIVLPDNTTTNYDQFLIDFKEKNGKDRN